MLCGSMITWGTQLSTRGPHALTGGPSMQVQFPHFKISTFNHCSTYPIIHKIKARTVTGGHRFGVMKSGIFSHAYMCQKVS